MSAKAEEQGGEGGVLPAIEEGAELVEVEQAAQVVLPGAVSGVQAAQSKDGVVTPSFMDRDPAFFKDNLVTAKRLERVYGSFWTGQDEVSLEYLETLPDITAEDLKLLRLEQSRKIGNVTALVDQVPGGSKYLDDVADVLRVGTSGDLGIMSYTHLSFEQIMSFVEGVLRSTKYAETRKFAGDCDKIMKGIRLSLVKVMTMDRIFDGCANYDECIVLLDRLLEIKGFKEELFGISFFSVIASKCETFEEAKDLIERIDGFRADEDLFGNEEERGRFKLNEKTMLVLITGSEGENDKKLKAYVTGREDLSRKLASPYCYRAFMELQDSFDEIWSSLEDMVSLDVPLSDEIIALSMRKAGTQVNRQKVMEFVRRQGSPRYQEERALYEMLRHSIDTAQNFMNCMLQFNQSKLYRTYSVLRKVEISADVALEMMKDSAGVYRAMGFDIKTEYAKYKAQGFAPYKMNPLTIARLDLHRYCMEMSIQDGGLDYVYDEPDLLWNGIKGRLDRGFDPENSDAAFQMTPKELESIDLNLFDSQDLLNRLTVYLKDIGIEEGLDRDLMMSDLGFDDFEPEYRSVLLLYGKLASNKVLDAQENRVPEAVEVVKVLWEEKIVPSAQALGCLDRFEIKGRKRLGQLKAAVSEYFVEKGYDPAQGKMDIVSAIGQMDAEKYPAFIDGWMAVFERVGLKAGMVSVKKAPVEGEEVAPTRNARVGKQRGGRRKSGKAGKGKN